MFTRYRFKTDPTDYRPVEFPPPGPYWCTGYSCNPNDESLSTEHAIVVAYLPNGESLSNWWPDAVGVETEQVEVIHFTDRFPCPDWWKPAQTETLRPTTLEGIKRLAKRIGREQGLRHAEALEVAAKQAGYATYHAARQALA